ncbi:uncharacterized protein LOC126899721 isoform X2 [Daktulosphaira vitifoliae]|uniref:uncharacterized protein LOC126899721 isoform X1 n=1 Tax=Daktulosphaira vitifoliae TaxID=58002 RepID=UPI0021AA7668|nr:uncharacterized protein LOC126899721 isoform X1 [Daktulosphaira vitifoliae]XP_050530793.1 uncharacterized protein LOC126899721 isoform X2 [Daktulosphaira vitifoliae]
MTLFFYVFFFSVFNKALFIEEAEKCPICYKDSTVTLKQCKHLLCNECAEKLRLRKEMKCPLCRRVILWFSCKGGMLYENELESIKIGVICKTISNEKLISHYYYLPPWQFADEKMLVEISQIYNAYPSEQLLEIREAIENFDVHWPEEDLVLRRRYFITILHNEEKEILKNYYIRNDLDVNEQFETRKHMYNFEIESSAESDSSL